MTIKVPFDATNREHQVAFAMLTQQKRQHPALRFIVEPPFNDALSMMYYKVGQEFLRQRPGVSKEAAAEALSQLNKAIAIAA